MTALNLVEELINIFKVDRYPLISIILPMYNAQNYICSSIESILSQTYLNWELIIINDGSTDNSLKIIKSKYLNLNYYKNKIKLINLTQNHGIVYSLNIGISKCNKNSKYIARMDADDISLNNRIEKQINFMIKKILIMIL